MKLNISINGKILLINHNTEKEFTFDINGTVDLNEFIKYISESGEIIEYTPESLKDFSDKNPHISKEMVKLIEYILKIIDAFNDSYNEVYNEKTDDDANIENITDEEDNLPF